MRLYDLIKEAPLPDDWDQAIYDQRVPFKKRVDYAKSMATKIGGGSSRIAFEIPYQGRKTVLKIAKNAKGMAQNEQEATMLEDWYLRNIGLFIPMIDYDQNSSQPTWIHTEYAQKATKAAFIAACGGTPEDLLAYTKQYFNRNKGFSYGNPDNINEESDLTMAFIDFAGNTDANISDYGRLANWGIYEGNPVIIDAGLSDDIYKKYYS